MINWVAPIGNFFGENSWQLLAIAFVFGLLALAKSFYQLIWNIQYRKLTHLRNALEVEGLSDEVKFMLVENLNRALFMQVTGIRTDQYTRKIYKTLLEKSEGDFTINHLKRASDFLKIENKNIIAECGWPRKFGYFFDKWYSLVLVAAAVMQVVVLIFAFNSALAALHIGLVIGSLLSAAFLYRRAVNYEIAREIEQFSYELQNENRD